MPRTNGAVNKPKFINIPLSTLVAVLKPNAIVPVERDVAEAINKLRALSGDDVAPFMPEDKEVETVEEEEDEPIQVTYHDFSKNDE